MILPLPARLAIRLNFQQKYDVVSFQNEGISCIVIDGFSEGCRNFHGTAIVSKTLYEGGVYCQQNTEISFDIKTFYSLFFLIT